MPRIYNVKNIIMTVNGRLITDLANGEFFNYEKNTEYATYEPSVTGEPGVYIPNGDDSYNATMTVKHTSPELPYLKELASNRTPIQVRVIDVNDVGTLDFSGSGMITTSISDSRSNAITNVTIPMNLSSVNQ